MRRSGVLCHISSLPSPYGIGTLGKAAYDFIDFLKKAGQTCWQVLPINPTGYGDSPYQGLSTFAGNPYLIDLDLLIEEGLLEKEEVEEKAWGDDPSKVDFNALFANRLEILFVAFSRFELEKNYAYQEYIKKESWWLDDFALFMALKQEHKFSPWYEWEEDIKTRKKEAIEEATKKYQKKIQFFKFLQYTFCKQWFGVKRYAKENGITIIGDVPIYVPHDSSDVWANPENYQLDEELNPIEVAGCPPDAFALTGQRWGNPLYAWDKMEKDDFTWWISRLRKMGEFVDVVRIDHFRGLESYWAIPGKDKTAENGRWVKGPGFALIKEIHKQLPDVSFIAEDLGFLTPEVIELQKKSGYPGMKILEFGFDSREPGDYTPCNYTPNCVCYTGTHDNETLAQWLENISEESRENVRKYTKSKPGDNLCQALIRCGMASVADLFVAQIQDYLELGADARMNTPSTLDPSNWVWRLTEEQMNDELAKKMHYLAKRYKRV